MGERSNIWGGKWGWYYGKTYIGMLYINRKKRSSLLWSVWSDFDCSGQGNLFISYQSVRTFCEVRVGYRTSDNLCCAGMYVSSCRVRSTVSTTVYDYVAAVCWRLVADCRLLSADYQPPAAAYWPLGSLNRLKVGSLPCCSLVCILFIHHVKTHLCTYVVSRDSRFGRVEILLWFSGTKSDSSGSWDGVARGSGLSRKPPRKLATPVASRREVPYVFAHAPQYLYPFCIALKSTHF